MVLLITIQCICLYTFEMFIVLAVSDILDHSHGPFLVVGGASAQRAGRRAGRQVRAGKGGCKGGRASMGRN